MALFLDCFGSLCLYDSSVLPIVYALKGINEVGERVSAPSGQHNPVFLPHIVPSIPLNPQALNPSLQLTQPSLGIPTSLLVATLIYTTMCYLIPSHGTGT